jgi:hypothetical protein
MAPFDPVEGLTSLAAVQAETAVASLEFGLHTNVIPGNDDELVANHPTWHF